MLHDFVTPFSRWQTEILALFSKQDIFKKIILLKNNHFLHNYIKPASKMKQLINKKMCDSLYLK